MMINLIDRFKEHLQAREDTLRCICKWGVQREGWFTAEMLAFLEKEIANDHLRVVQSFDREVKIHPASREKVDFSVLHVARPSTPVWIEFKHWLIGQQKGKSYDASWYFSQKPTPRQPKNGLKSDVARLSAIVDGEKYVVVAATAAPTQSDWQNGVELFNRAVTEKGRQLQSLTDVRNYPDYFFLGLLRVAIAAEAT